MVADGSSLSVTSEGAEGELDSHRGPEDQLDTLVRIAGPGMWIGCIGLALLVVGVVVWAFGGTISQKTAGQGVTLSGSGLRNVYTHVNGTVTDPLIRVGDQVVAGQALFFVVGHGASRKAVAAPVAGTVLDLNVQGGQVVTAGMTSAVIAPEGPVWVLAYVPLAQGKTLEPDMPVEVLPLTVPRELGYMLGRVWSISPYPVPMDEAAERMDSALLAEGMFAGGAALEVRITLEPDEADPSGYRWSSGSGPTTPLTVGTPTEVEVITGTKRPVDLLTTLTGAFRWAVQ